MRTIPLTRGMEAIVDNEDYESLAVHKWCVQPTDGGKWFYAVRREGTQENNRLILMHRQITGAQRGQIVDHKNRNTLDNRRENLRLCNCKQNAANMDRGKRFKGVCKSRSGIYVAKIMVDYRSIHLGTFDKVEAAAAAYDIAAKEHFGEFARTNFTDESRPPADSGRTSSQRRSDGARRRFERERLAGAGAPFDVDMQHGAQGREV